MNPGTTNTLLRVDRVSKTFMHRVGLGRPAPLHAVSDVSFSLDRGEVLALVGESGSGKSTLGRLAIRVLEPTSGTVTFNELDITTLSRRALRPLRRQMQLIFQDPYGSLDPRIRIGKSIAEGIRLHNLAGRENIRDRVGSAIERVGLRRELATRFPSALSGGQRQRVAIARALAVEPTVIVADEPTSALDVSVQAEIIELLKGLQRDQQLSMLFISHDLRVVGDISDKVLVLYLGHIVEFGPTRQVYTQPRHPYTEALLRSVPRDPASPSSTSRIRLTGELPNPMSPPKGCVFHPRCQYALEECKTANMSRKTVAPGHDTACIRTDLSLTSAQRIPA